MYNLELIESNLYWDSESTLKLVHNILFLILKIVDITFMCSQEETLLLISYKYDLLKLRVRLDLTLEKFLRGLDVLFCVLLKGDIKNI